MTTQLERAFEGQEVELVYVQTTFEGFEQNDFERAQSERARWKITRPVGHDLVSAIGPGQPRLFPHTMRDYRTGGTPWTVIIDRQGRVRFNDFTRDYAVHHGMIEALLR